MIATGIKAAHIGYVWKDLWPMLEPAHKRSADKSNVLAGIYSHRFQLWAVFDNVVPVAGIVTRFNRVGTSGDLHCRIWLVGGCRLNDWAPDFIAKLALWAKSEGCVCLDGSGRKGWARIVSRFGGYRVDDEDGEPAWRLDL